MPRRRTRLTSADCEKIRRLFVDGRRRDAKPARSRDALARRFGITPGTVSRLRRAAKDPAAAPPPAA
jgi:hypothetical protein